MKVKSYMRSSNLKDLWTTEVIVNGLSANVYYYSTVENVGTIGHGDQA